MAQHVRATSDTIKAFLDLPAEALPSARWASSCDEDCGDCWAYLRDYVRPDSRRRLNHFGQTIRLAANRPEWRDGVSVVLR